MELRLSKVIKRYGAGAAVDGIDLTFASGKTTALLGPSGCGKSTVLRLLVGLVTPDAGAITVDGRPLPARDIEALRRRIGYVIQDGGLFPHLTAAENVTLMARYLRWDAGRVARRLDEPLGALDPLVRAELRDDLRAIFRSLGKTVVVVTHDVGEAAHLADVIV